MNQSGNQAWNPTFPFILARGTNEYIFWLCLFSCITDCSDCSRLKCGPDDSVIYCILQNNMNKPAFAAFAFGQYMYQVVWQSFRLAKQIFKNGLWSYCEILSSLLFLKIYSDTTRNKY